MFFALISYFGMPLAVALNDPSIVVQLVTVRQGEIIYDVTNAVKQQMYRDGKPSFIAYTWTIDVYDLTEAGMPFLKGN